MALRGGKEHYETFSESQSFWCLFRKERAPNEWNSTHPSMGKFFPDVRREIHRAFMDFLFQGKIPNSSHPKNPTFPPQNFPPETLDEIMKGKPTSKSALSIGTTLGSEGIQGEKIPDFFPESRNTQVVCIFILKIPVPHTHPWDERHIYPAMNGSG